MEHTLPIFLQCDENLDVGCDTGTPVDDQDYQVPFEFTGKLNKLTFNLGPEQLTEEERKQLPAIADAVARAKD